MPSVASQSAPNLHPMAHSNLDSPLASPTRIVKREYSIAPSPRLVLNAPSAFSPNSGPPPGARPPIIRRVSRLDPMETGVDDDGHGELGPRHPLRRIREDRPPMPDHRDSDSSSVSLPGIKALLNAADQPPLVSPFGQFYASPSVTSVTNSGVSPLDSPTSRTSRFSSSTSSVNEGGQSGGWWAPDERSTSSYPSRAGSFSTRGPLDEEPDFKRRRSDLAPTLPDADEIARLKWQAQSRNASFPASGSISSASGHGLRSMLYPPLSSSTLSRGSISGTPLASPLTPPVESQYDMNSSRNSPMTGPLTRSFADLTASERSPQSEGHPPSRNRSPVERRPSLFRPSLSNESIPQIPSLREVPSPGGPGGDPQRVSRTRPPSPEPLGPKGDRRKSLAELIMESSGDDVAMAKGGRFFTSGPPGPSPSDSRLAPPEAPMWPVRRESTESIHSVTSVPGMPPSSDSELGGSAVLRERQNAVLVPPPPHDRRRSFVGGVEEEELAEPKSDPGMRGMEVLASESARRLADERKDDDRETSPTKNSGPSSGPKYSCNYCAKTFSRPSSLRIHTYSHTGERPFVCKEPSCRRRFSVQSNLKRHAKVHQLQAQQAQAAQINQRSAQPRHPMHMGPNVHGGPQPPVYYATRPGPPPPHPHMHMAQHHPPPPGYGHGPPPPGYMGGPQPGHPGFDGHGPPPHFQPQGMRPGHGDHMAAHYHAHQRRHSHDVDPAGRPGGPPGGDDWVSEDEEDELDDDE